MAVFWKATAGGLLFTLGLALLCFGAEGQEKKEVPGSSTVYLGQHRDTWKPLIHTSVNLTEIRSMRSSFQLRTYDPEGAVFYGDTKDGKDWFIFSLKDGVPLMQISRDNILVSVTGGPTLNDGKWHTLEVSNHGNFVILEVDGSRGLEVSLQSARLEEVISGGLRLALGGFLNDPNKLAVQFDPAMDGCVRDGTWLNLSIPWELETDELWSCSENIRPGSFFPGTGFAVFNISEFHNEDDPAKFELWGDFSQMDGTIMSIRSPGQELLFSLVADSNTKEVTLTFGNDKISMKETLKRLVITFQTDILQVLQDEDESKTTEIPVSPESHPGYLSTWKEGRLAFGGLLGEGEDDVGSHFLKGCLEKIRFQGNDVDLDTGVKHMLITSYSCPA